MEIQSRYNVNIYIIYGARDISNKLTKAHYQMQFASLIPLMH